MYSFDSRIRYSETDSEGQLTLEALINYFQDCSTFQSEDLNMGIERLKELGIVWVLCYWQIQVIRLPGLGEKVRIGTLPYELKSFMGLRNFVMTDENGEYLAKAWSVWSLLDIQTNRFVSIPEEMYEKYAVEDRIEMDYAPRKIRLPEAEEIRGETIVIKKHHLDTNHHVNNEQFVMLAKETLPDDFKVGQLRVEYKKQAFLEDRLVPYIRMTEKCAYVVLKNEDGVVYTVTEFTRKE